MTARTLALLLIWGGALLLAVLVGARIRAGAWTERAFDAAPRVPRWTWPVLALGAILVAAGTAGMLRHLR